MALSPAPTQASLRSFRLAQRLQRLHPLGSAAVASASIARCKEAAARESSAPYPSCGTFRASADLFLDALGGASCRFEPSLVFPGAVIFVNTLLLPDFMLNKHPFIRAPYTLITHCSDASAPAEFDGVLDDPRLIGWYAQNADLSSHRKLHPIPIGVANIVFPHGDKGVISRAVAARRPPGERDAWLYVNFDESTNADRARALAAVAANGLASAKPVKGVPFDQYLGEVSRHKFVLCPQGNGLDTHRLWEALLVGSVPVVARSTLDSLYDGLPVVIVVSFSPI